MEVNALSEVSGMSGLLYVAALLLVGLGLTHSILGEKYILIRLFRRDNLPKLFGSDDFTKRTLRFAWHITTIAWFGLAAVLVLLVQPTLNFSVIANVIGVTLLLHFVMALVGSKGKHFSWPVFLVMGVCIVIGANN